MTKNNIVADIENDGQPGLCNKYHFKDYGLMQFLNILYPKEVKPPKTNKKVSENEKQFVNDRIYDITIVKRKDFYSQRTNLTSKLYNEIIYFSIK